MKKYGIGFILLFGLHNILFAQQLPPLQSALEVLHPQNIFPLYSDTAFQFNDRTKASQAATFTASIVDNTPIFTAEIFAASPKSHYDIQTVWRSEAAVKKGDVLLARFAIRSIYAKQESGEAVVYFYVQNANDKSVIVDISAGPEWKTIAIPFTAAADMDKGEAQVCFSFGALVQKVEIGSIQVLNFEQKVNIKQLPVTRFTYQGREANAPWRTAALKRIEELRTAPLQVKVTDAKGKPINGATVQATMVQSDFVWGTAVKEVMLANEDADAEKFKQIIKELFNTAVIENGFKAARWSGAPERKVETLKAFDWLKQNDFRQRGHNLVWPGWKFNTKLFRETAQKDTAAFRLLIEQDMRSKMAFTNGQVIAWDVINELMHERAFLPYLPQDMPEQWFKLAKALDPKAQLFINEYGLLNSISSPANIKTYLDTIARLRHNGAPIDAIGVQGHVGRQPRNPAQVISDLDLFTPTGLPVQITEFDINMTDGDLQADYTRDFLIACYSHPAVTGFTIWGFWAGGHWKPDAAMFRQDWTPKPNAAVWREWVTGQWKTNWNAVSDNAGKVSGRGHLGRYEITVSKNGKEVKTIYQLQKNALPLGVQLK